MSRKDSLGYMQTAKNQINLGIIAAWSRPSLYDSQNRWILHSLCLPDQITRMHMSDLGFHFS